MVLKLIVWVVVLNICFRSMSYWMVLKPTRSLLSNIACFRSMSYWMVLKRDNEMNDYYNGFRSMSYWMVLKIL